MPPASAVPASVAIKACAAPDRRRGNAQVITCRVPLAEMFGYSTDLRSLSQGRANYTMQFASYEQAPKNVSEEVVAKAAG